MLERIERLENNLMMFIRDHFAPVIKRIEKLENAEQHDWGVQIRALSSEITALQSMLLTPVQEQKEIIPETKISEIPSALPGSETNPTTSTYVSVRDAKPRVERGRGQYTYEDWCKIMELKKEGKTQKDIAKLLCMPYPSIVSIIKWSEAKVQRMKVKALGLNNALLTSTSASNDTEGDLPSPSDDSYATSGWNPWTAADAVAYKAGMTNNAPGHSYLVSVQYADGSMDVAKAYEVVWHALGDKQVTAWRYMRYA